MTGPDMAQSATGVRRYAYVKNGDPIRQMEELEADARKVPQGGPNAFLADFLQMTGSYRVMILSGVDRDVARDYDQVAVRTFSSHILAGSFLNKLWKRLGGVARFTGVLFGFRPDVIVCGKTREYLWMSYIVAVLTGATLIHSRHNRVDHGAGQSMLGRSLAAIDGFFIRRCHAVICHGPYLKAQLIELGVPRERIFEFDSGFEDFAPGIASDRSNENKLSARTVIFVGRIECAKGATDILEAMLPMLSGDGDVELIYVGDGSAFTEIRQRVNEQGLAGSVRLMGRINHQELPKIMATARVMVVPTRSSFPEGRCMSAMEGLVMGIPVIAPNFGPFPYLVEDGVNGLLYEPDSITQLRAAISRLLYDDRLYGTLCEGARASGVDFRVAKLSFSGAITMALAGNAGPAGS